MSTSCYWLLRHENRLLTIDDPTGVTAFPFGLPHELDNPTDALLIGEWQGAPCYAAEIDTLPEGPTQAMARWRNAAAERLSVLAALTGAQAQLDRGE